MNQVQNSLDQSVPAVSAVVVTWNNLDSLQQCLAALDKAVLNSGFATEIIIVDNGSGDGTREFLEKNPKVRYFGFDSNTGFGPASNQGIRMARAPLIVLLNDDILVDAGFLNPMVRHFERPAVFAVAPLMVMNGKPLSGRSVGVFRKGLLEIEVRNDFPGKPAATLFAGGGAGLFRREMLLDLGSFDPLYHPFYFEDLDLSYRAWKRGLICISEPASIVHHHHAGTIGRRFSQRFVYAISRRNHILFHWKNIHDSNWISEHVRHLIRKCLVSLVSFKLAEIWAISLAIIKIVPSLRARTAEAAQITLNDRAVLEKISKNMI